jgi:hypothetical protein
MMKIYGRVRVPLCPIWWSEYRNVAPERRDEVADRVDWSNAIELLSEGCNSESLVAVTRVWINGKLQPSGSADLGAVNGVGDADAKGVA